MKRLFPGGIHPYSQKKSTRKKALALPVFPPSRIVLPLYTTREDILEPIVRQGEGVKIGQKIAIGQEGSALPIFSGISGTVSKIGLESHPFYGKTPAVVISNDFKNSKLSLHPTENPLQLSPTQIMEQLSRLGVRGMTLDEEPVSQKIQRLQGNAQTLILNAVECEPYITADYRLLLDRLDLVIKGSLLLAQALGSECLVFAVQGDKMGAIEALEQHPLWEEDSMKARPVPTRYPYGEEKQVIRLVTGQEIPRNASSTQANCGVFNVATAYAVGDAIYHGAAQTHRVVTVSGGAVKRPRNLWLPLGTPLESLFVNGEGMKEEPSLIILGGPMTGIVQKDMRAPLLVSSSGLLAMTKREIPAHLWPDSPPSTMPCIGCGHCLTVCPVHLMPNMVHRHMNKPEPNPRILAKFQPDACIGCGACNYRCPAHLPLAKEMDEAEWLVAEYQAMKMAEEELVPVPPPIPVEDDMVTILVVEPSSVEEIPPKTEDIPPVELEKDSAEGETDFSPTLVPPLDEPSLHQENPGSGNPTSQEAQAHFLQHLDLKTGLSSQDYLPDFDSDEVIILVEEPDDPEKGAL